MSTRIEVLVFIVLISLLTMPACKEVSLNSVGIDPTPTPTPTPTPVSTPAPVVSASALFSQSFDSAPDWQSVESFSPVNYARWPQTWVDYPGGPALPPPQGFYSYRSAKPLRNETAHTFVLSSEGARNPGGKGMTYNIESSSYGTWTGGGLDVYLGSTGAQELFVRLYLKYDPNTFFWGTVVPNFGVQKVARISRLKCIPDNGTTCSPQIFYSANSLQAPTFYPDFFSNPAYNTPPSINPNHFKPLIVTDPGAGNAIADDQWQMPWPSDGKWHSYEYRVKMNSAPGVADGSWEVWIDGSGATDRHFARSGIAWVLSDGAINPGWNWISLLDNTTIQPDPIHQNSVMKLFMDDVVISTHYSGPPPAPTGVTGESNSTGSAQLAWTPGSNGASFLLSGYRIYYGTAPGALTQSVTIGTTTAHELSGLISGQTYYFAVTAVNHASYDGNENESLRSSVVSVSVR